MLSKRRGWFFVTETSALTISSQKNIISYLLYAITLEIPRERENIKSMSTKLTLKAAIRERNAFTIVELLIVIVVIAILTAITIVAYNGMQARAQDSQRLSVMNSLKKSIEEYYILNGNYPECGNYSCTSTGSVGDISTLPISFKVPKDPKNVNGSWGYYYAHLHKMTSSNSLVYTGNPGDYVIATRLDNGKVATFSGWNNSNLNYLDGNSQ